MTGLTKNSNAHVLAQWQKLFYDQNADLSTEASIHWKAVRRLGLPTRQHEHWKYTPLEGLLGHYFTPATTCALAPADRDALSLKLDACRLVFVDGCFSEALSDSNTGAWDVKVEEGAARLLLPPPIQPEVFLHLTESLSKQTTRIRLPARKVSKRPLYLLQISQGSKDKKALHMLHYRHHLDIGIGAQGKVIEHFVSINNQGHFSGARTSITVGDSAKLSHVKLAFESRASYHFSHNDITLGRDAVVHSSAFILGAGLTRHQTSAQLNGEGSDLAINSLLLPSERDISDIRTYLEHNKGYCISRQLHKVIARDHGKGVFNGLIKVAKHAVKTDSRMTNNNLLLDHQAEVNSKPQLEIYADDVKCSHAATVGQIQQEQMFYLRSRGITRDAAQKMIIYAFASEVTEAIDQDVIRDTVLERISHIL
ncbi:Fe-S cluster assembly protein SufD [secondary endosymbiont of Ctenarytaina eucalypti]|uniref:FeS assembly protein SufD n=1 Tax=secondary endosymbiont of Ctenarytaina eucalypti TaxID=1199245 RepID=J3TWW0_9ENTR|nr:Fe-S cluster assembly protein SufD [secondary endosymbiont of Ctenarytaina eucalypti]AFP84515.1 FeS assembly protein SufD [secondary endosymbiont of Ctenarytaina eucalypti]